MMGTGLAGHVGGAFHEAAVYSDDDEFLAIVVPFLEGGLESGVPTFSVFDEGRQQLVRDAVRNDSVHYLAKNDLYARPASTIVLYRRMLRELADGGAAQIRVVGDLPHVQVVSSWDKWAHYEAALNEVFDDFPLWALCSYDTRITSDAVLHDVLATHPYIADVDGRHRTNGKYVDPHEFLRDRVSYRNFNDVGLPQCELLDPSPSGARRAVRHMIQASPHIVDHVDDLMIAVSEIVTNANLHGELPVRLRAWISESRCVVSVSDQGNGFADPLMGMVPVASGDAQGGRGLWIANQICAEVDVFRDEHGFTVRVEFACGSMML